MCNELSIPEEIDDIENIARVLYSPLLVEDGVVSASAFHLRNLKRPEEYVSVFRHDYVIPTLKNTSFIRVPEDNEMYGYALLNVGKCRGISFKEIKTEVLPHPNEKNPSHAGIHYNKGNETIKGICIDPDFMIITQMLANNSVLYPFEGQ